MLKKNDIINLKIESITNLGFGVGRHEGLVIFVSDAVTGDEAEVKIIKLTPSYVVGRVEKFIKTFELRDTSRCNNKSCHSCAYKSISYAHEKELKQTEVKEAFKKAGLSEVKIESLVGSPSCKNYRNKAQYPISMSKNGEYVIGFYAPKSHRVTDAVNCPLAPEIFSDIIKVLTAFFKKHMLSVYNEEVGQGLLRHVYLRRADQSGEVLLTLVINGSALPCEEALVARVREKFPAVVGILLNENREDTNVILSDSYRTLYGKNYMTDVLSGVTLKIAPSAFYQVNHDGAELLYGEAKKLAGLKKTDLLLDLYCGTGAIGLSMAKDVREVIGIEIVADAIECAKQNAALSGIENASFFVGDAADAEKILENAEKARGEKIRPDVIVLDPPRKGCDARLLSFVASLSPRRIVYVSCNPDTLARDMAILKPLGYETDKVQPVDMFPATGHVESVVCLTRR